MKFNYNYKFPKSTFSVFTKDFLSFNRSELYLFMVMVSNMDFNNVVGAEIISGINKDIRSRGLRGLISGGFIMVNRNVKGEKYYMVNPNIVYLSQSRKRSLVRFYEMKSFNKVTKYEYR